MLYLAEEKGALRCQARASTVKSRADRDAMWSMTIRSASTMSGRAACGGLGCVAKTPSPGKDWRHRKAWFFERLQELTAIFAIDACVWAILCESLPSDPP